MPKPNRTTGQREPEVIRYANEKHVLATRLSNRCTHINHPQRASASQQNHQTFKTIEILYIIYDLLYMVDVAGVEPAVPFGRRIYSPLGLPIFLHIHVWCQEKESNLSSLDYQSSALPLSYPGKNSVALRTLAVLLT